MSIPAATFDPSRRLDIHFRIKRVGSKKFIFVDEDGAAIDISTFAFALYIREYAGARTNTISLTVGSGLTVGGSGNNELTASFTVANTTVNEKEYYWELYKGLTSKTYLSGKAFAHNGVFDGVSNDSESVTITDETDTVTVVLSDVSTLTPSELISILEDSTPEELQAIAALLDPYLTGGAGFSPISITPSFWLQGSNDSKLTPINDSLGQLISSFSSSDSNAYSLVPESGVASPYTTVPAYNGEGIYSSGATCLKLNNNKTAFKYLHDGTAFTLYFNFKILKSDPNALGVIFSTNQILNTNVGFSLSYDDRSAVPRNNRILFNITNGTSFIVSLVSTDNVWTPKQYNWGKVTHDGTNYTLYVNGVSVATGTRSGSVSTANHTQDARFFSDSTLAFGLGAINKNILCWNRLLSASEQTQMDTWIAAQNQTYNRGNANVYFQLGQSNASGQGLNSAISSALNGKVGARIYAGYNYSASDYWDELELGVNQTPENVATIHGFEMRFGREMALANSNNCFIVKVSKDGTPIAQVASDDWNTASANEMYARALAAANNALRELTYELSYTPIIRGLIYMQGETDCNTAVVPAGGGAAWQGRFETLLKGFVDYVATASSATHDTGWTTDKMRVTIFRCHNNFSGHDATEKTNLRLGQVHVGDSFLADFPAYASKVKSTRWVDTDSVALNGDSLHYSAAGLDVMGAGLYTYYSQYVNE